MLNLREITIIENTIACAYYGIFMTLTAANSLILAIRSNPKNTFEVLIESIGLVKYKIKETIIGVKVKILRNKVFYSLNIKAVIHIIIPIANIEREYIISSSLKLR